MKNKEKKSKTNLHDKHSATVGYLFYPVPSYDVCEERFKRWIYDVGRLCCSTHGDAGFFFKTSLRIFNSKIEIYLGKETYHGRKPEKYSFPDFFIPEVIQVNWFCLNELHTFGSMAHNGESGSIQSLHYFISKISFSFFTAHTTIDVTINHISTVSTSSMSFPER